MMKTIRNCNERFGNPTEFRADTEEQAVEDMQRSIRECGGEFQDVVVTEQDYELNHGDLHDYQTGQRLRSATEAEHAESVEAAEHDGGAGVIDVDGRSCYVSD